MPYFAYIARLSRASILEVLRSDYIRTAKAKGLKQSQIMYKHYYINNNQTLNPGLHHEVHTKEHAEQLGIRSAQYVGYFASETEAVAQAKKIYSDADGCVVCCPKAHRG